MSKDLVETLHKEIMWGNIRRLAEKDPYIKDLLDKIEVYYRLKYERRQAGY